MAHANFDFSDSRVLVTGGTSGIGYGIAHAFHAAGAQVAVTGTRAAAKNYDGVDLSPFRYHSLNMEDNEAVTRLGQSLDGLDILVNNAGQAMPGGGDEWQPDTFEHSVQVNLTSAYRMAHACLPALAASGMTGGASIIGICSLTSFFGTDIVPGYGAAKAGLAQLTKSLAIKWAEHGVRANSIAAGMIDTPMTKSVTQTEAREPVLARTPLKRFGQPEDVAAFALFFASAEASFMTGETVIVDGGYTASV